MSSLTCTPGAPGKDPAEDGCVYIPPPAVAPNHATAQAEAPPAPPRVTSGSHPDGGVAPLDKEVTDKFHSAFATLGQNPTSSPDWRLEDETLPDTSMLDHTVETSNLSVALTSPAAASLSTVARYSREMKSTLTPMFKFSSGYMKSQTPGQARPGETTGHDVSLPNREVFAECHKKEGFRWYLEGLPPVRSPYFWLKDEMLPEISMDSTMESSHLSPNVAGTSFVPPFPDPHLAETPEAGEKTTSDPGSMLNLTTDQSLIPTPHFPASTEKQNGGEGLNLTDHSRPRVPQMEGAVVLQGPPEASSTCPRPDVTWESVLPDGEASLGASSLCSASAPESHNQTTHVTTAGPPVDLNTTHVLSGNSVEVASSGGPHSTLEATSLCGNGTFIIPPDEASVNSNVTVEATDSSGAKCNKSLLPPNRTLESKPDSTGRGATVLLGDVCSGSKLKDTFEMASSPASSAPGCSKDNQSVGEDNQGVGEDNQCGGQENQIGSRGNRSTEDNQNFEAHPCTLSTNPCDGANNALVVAVDLPVQSEVNTTQAFSRATAEVAGSTMCVTPLDSARLSPEVNTNITMEPDCLDAESEDNSLRHKMLKCTPIYKGSADLDFEDGFDSTPKPVGLGCEDGGTHGPPLITSTPLPDCRLHAAPTQTVVVQQKHSTHAPAKRLLQMKSPSAKAERATPAVRSFLPQLRPPRPVSHGLRPPSGPEPRPLAATKGTLHAVAPPPNQRKPKNTSLPDSTSAALPGIPSTKQRVLPVLRPPSARLSTTASCQDKRAVASADKPRQSLSHAKRSLQPRSEAPVVTKRRRTDVQGPSTTMKPSRLSMQPTREAPSLRASPHRLPLRPHTSRTQTQGCPNCVRLQQEVEEKDAELRRLQKEIGKLEAQQRKTILRDLY